MVKTPCFRGRGLRFDPWELRSHTPCKPKKKKKGERERKEERGRGRERRKEKRKKPLSAFLLLASLNEFKREFLKMLNSDSTLQLFQEIESLIQSLLFRGRN